MCTYKLLVYLTEYALIGLTLGSILYYNIIIILIIGVNKTIVWMCYHIPNVQYTCV